MPYGFFDFVVEGMAVGGETTVNIHVPDGSIVDSYYKYGPTPDNPTDQWYEFTYDGQTGAEVNGNVITLNFVDGLRGDDDLTANGTIVDPGAPVSTVAPSAASIGDFVWHDLYHGPGHLVDGIGHTANPHLKRGAIVEHFSDVSSDLSFHLARRIRLELGQFFRGFDVGTGPVGPLFLAAALWLKRRRGRRAERR